MRPKHPNQSLIKSHSVYKCSTRSYITFNRRVRRSSSLLSSQLLSHHHKFPPSLSAYPRLVVNPLISAVNTWRAGASYPEPFPTLRYKYSSFQPLRLCSVSCVFFLVVLVAQENIWDSRRIPNLHSDRKRTDTSGDERFRFGQQTSVGQIRLQVVDLYYLYYVNSVWT